MTLKTSFCNKSLVKADLKRFWWIGAVYTLLIFLLYTFNYLQRHYNGAGFTREYVEYTSSYVYNYGIPVFVLAFIIPVICAVLLFSYMQSGSPSTFAHCIPLTRKQSYISHLVSGFILIFVPHIINALVFVLCRFDRGFAQTFKLSHLLTVIYTGLIYALLAFSVATFTSFVAGNSVAGIIFAYVLGFLPFALEFGIKEFLKIQLFGYPASGNDFIISQYIYIGANNFTQIKYILYYLILSAVFFVLGFLIYRLRNLENHSEVVAFPKIKPLFIYGVAIAFGFIGYFYFYGVFHLKSALYLIPFGVIGIIVAQMVSQKNFRVKGVLKSLVAYSVCAVILYVIFNFDVLGYERRIPTADNIESIVYDLDINTDRGYMYIANGEKVLTDNKYEPLIKNGDAINDITKLHSAIIQNKANIQSKLKNNYYFSNSPVKLTYNLKNGKKLERYYAVNYFDLMQEFNSVAEYNEVKLSYFPLLRNRNINVEEVSVSDSRINGDDTFVKLYGDDAKRLIESLKTDMLNADANEFASRGETFTRINVKFKPEAFYENGLPVNSDLLNTISESYYVRTSYKNTNDILNGFENYQKICRAEDISKIGVICYDMYAGLVNKEIQLDGDYEKFNNVIENTETINAIYEYIKNNGSNRNYSNGYIKFILKDGSWFNHDYSTYDETLLQLLELN